MKSSKGIIGNSFPLRPFHIIGAGISGLLLAHHLKKQGIPYTIYEKSQRAGGKIWTVQTPFGPSELAANALYSDSDIIELLYHLKLSPLRPQKKLKKRILFKNGLRSAIGPLNPLKILYHLIFTKPPQIDKMTSLEALFRPLLGEKFSYLVLSSILSGIYAIDSKSFPALHYFSFLENKSFKNYFQLLRFIYQYKKKERLKHETPKHKAESLSFPSGMIELISALETEHRTSIQYVDDMNLNTLLGENIVLCTDALEASTLLKGIVPDILSKSLSSIEYKSLQTNTIFTKTALKKLKQCFGALITPDHNFQTLGILANHEIFGHKFRTKQEAKGSYTLISKYDELKTEDETLKQSINELSSYFKEFKEQSNILFTQIKRWHRALPVYDFKRKELIQKIRLYMYEAPQGLHLFGNYVDGISIREMNKMAKDFACQYLKTSKK